MAMIAFVCAAVGTIAAFAVGRVVPDPLTAGLIGSAVGGGLFAILWVMTSR